MKRIPLSLVGEVEKLGEQDAYIADLMEVRTVPVVRERNDPEAPSRDGAPDRLDPDGGRIGYYEPRSSKSTGLTAYL